MDFIKYIAPYAVKYMKSEEILASLTIAQAILESDWGKSELALNANNLFGIKASLPWVGPKYRKKTKEFRNNKWIEIFDEFCQFESIEECIEYRSSVFLKKPRYAKLWGITDYKEACQTIYESGYATDPNYPQKLIDVIEKYELYQYDKKEDNGLKLYSDPERDMNKVSDWAKKDWEEAVLNGYLDGSRQGVPITREEMAIVINRLRHNFLKLINKK